MKVNMGSLDAVPAPATLRRGGAEVTVGGLATAGTAGGYSEQALEQRRIGGSIPHKLYEHSQ